MKTLRTLLVIAIVMAGFTFQVKAQKTIADNNATAKVLTIINLAKGATSLNFGAFAASSTSAGTVVVPATGSASATGGITLSTTDATSAAAFTASGEAGYTYQITLPEDDVVTLTKSGAPDMTVTNFVGKTASGAAPSHTPTGTLTAGSENFTVGATLNVAQSQPAGTYTGQYSVTVNYN